MEEGEELDDVLIEIEILKEVRHPNIVSYYNSYIDTDSQELWVYSRFFTSSSRRFYRSLTFALSLIQIAMEYCWG